ncbi:MAG: DNA-3-methyladenine glycosylase family protein [Dethiobacteria bacterium]
MDIFKYGLTEAEYLKSRDKKLGAAIDKIGMIKREITPDPFTALILSVISQQISKKAAATIKTRLFSLLDELTPDKILRANLIDIKNCGMSERKAGYIRGIAEAAVSGKIDFPGLRSMSDEHIIEKLSALHGVGVWTAEMLLIFSLCRPDVVSYRDLAIRRGMINLYGLKDLTNKEFERYRQRFSPYGSVASLYLWELSAE